MSDGTLKQPYIRGMWASLSTLKLSLCLYFLIGLFYSLIKGETYYDYNSHSAPVFFPWPAVLALCLIILLVVWNLIALTTVERVTALSLTMDSIRIWLIPLSLTCAVRNR